MQTKSIAFFNNKGGVGKTTFACNMAHYLATRAGQRTILVDMDPQCNATQLTLERVTMGGGLLRQKNLTEPNDDESPHAHS